jgi:hypothetical protein
MKEKRLLNNHGCLFVVEGKIVKRKIGEFFRVGKEEYPLKWTKPLTSATKEEVARIKNRETELAELDLKLDELLGR